MGSTVGGESEVTEMELPQTQMQIILNHIGSNNSGDNECEKGVVIDDKISGNGANGNDSTGTVTASSQQTQSQISQKSQRQRPGGFRPPQAKKTAEEPVKVVPSKPAKLTKQDATCPICWSILIEPTTLPCSHSLCTACYQQHVDETSLYCPCCRRRLSVWSRKVQRNHELLDVELWSRIKEQFPDLVEARMSGRDSEMESLANTTTADLSQPLVHDGILNAPPGEIFKELKEIIAPHEKDIESQRLQQEAASADLIQQLQGEGSILKASNNVEDDFVFAHKLQAELDLELVPRKSTRLSSGVVKPRFDYHRNMLKDYDIECLTPSDCGSPVVKPKRKPRAVRPSTGINKPAKKARKASATVTSCSSISQENDAETTMSIDENNVLVGTDSDIGGNVATTDGTRDNGDDANEESQPLTFSPSTLKVRFRTQDLDYIPSSQEKRFPPIDADDQADEFELGDEEHLYLEKEARTLKLFEKKVQQEQEDLALAQMLQKNYDRGIEVPRGKNCMDEYGLRSWRKRK